MPASSQAQPAYFQDCLDEDGTEVLEPKTVARHKPRASSRTDRRREPREPSDSGYSSHASGTITVKPADPNPSQAMVRHAPAASSASSKSSSKTVIHRRDSARVPSGAQSQSPSPDPYCRDPNCSCTRSVANRRMSMSQAPRQPAPPAPPTSQPQPQPPQLPQQPRSIPYPTSASAQYQQQAQIQQSYYHYYPQMTGVPMPPAVPQAVPRPRADSSNRPRPVSIHGYSMPSYGSSYDDSQRGPPPSASAYYPNVPIGYAPQPKEYLASTPPDPTTLGFPPYSPGLASPTSPTSTGAASGYLGSGSNIYSTRRGNPNVTGLIVPKLPTPAMPSRAPSARRLENPRTIAPAMQEPESPEYSSASDDSALDDDDHDEEVVYERPSRRNDMVLVHRRRPSLKRDYHTTPNIPSVPIQEHRPQELRRAPLSDSNFDYYSSSDHVDSDRTDRTTRAILPAREAPPSSRSSRRPSVSTNASSGRTKATTVSSMSDYSRVVIEDKNGRRTRYLSGDQANQLKRLKSLKTRDKQYDLDEKERAQLRLEEVAAYQRFVSGEAYELTAENMRKSQNRKSGSHLSGARTHRSSHSGSKASRANDGGIRIESGGTVLHVYGDASIEMRQDEEGGPAHLIVNGNRGDNTYTTGSRSTDSRIGRSRLGSESGRSRRYSRQPIYEEIEGPYERNL